MMMTGMILQSSSLPRAFHARNENIIYFSRFSLCRHQHIIYVVTNNGIHSTSRLSYSHIHFLFCCLLGNLSIALIFCMYSSYFFTARIAYWYRRPPAGCVIPGLSPGMENEYFFFRKSWGWFRTCAVYPSQRCSMCYARGIDHISNGKWPYLDRLSWRILRGPPIGVMPWPTLVAVQRKKWIHHFQLFVYFHIIENTCVCMSISVCIFLQRCALERLRSERSETAEYILYIRKLQMRKIE